MTFLSPVWLLGWLLIPLIAGLIFWEDRRRCKQLSRFAHPVLWPLLAPDLLLGMSGPRLRKAFVLLLAFGCLFLALARPQWGSHLETLRVSGLDILIVLDISQSMETEDVVPSRLKKAKHGIRSLLQRLQGDRVGLVAFAGSAYVACPLTTDFSYVLDTLQMLDPRSIPHQGTRIGTALEVALHALERGGEHTPSPNERSVPSHVIILISDGEDHEHAALTIADTLQKNAIPLYVLGVGTEKGGPIPVHESRNSSPGLPDSADPRSDKPTYKKDSRGQAIVSTFHPGALQAIAAQAKGQYWTLSTHELEMEELLRSLNALNRGDLMERRYLIHEERFQIPLFLALLFFGIELSMCTRRRSSLKTTIDPTTAALVALFFLFLPLSFSHAQSSSSYDTYWNTQKGMEAYRDGKIDEAMQRFGAAQARDPNRPELHFNQGILQLEQGNPTGSAQSFQKAAQEAFKNQDLSLYEKAWYNLGAVFVQQGQIKDAIHAYRTVIQSTTQSKHPVLERKARKNLQLLLNPPPKKDPPKDHKPKSDPSPSPKNPPDAPPSPSPSSSPSAASSSEQPSLKKEVAQDFQKQDSKLQSFQSQKMKAEDANRVLEELKNRERELQEKLQKQHAKQNAKQTNHEHDW